MDLEAADIFYPPVKRSVTIAGHQTSITLEPLFWELLRNVSEQQKLPINAVIAQIDLARMGSDEPPGLATAIRLWLTNDLLGKTTQAD